MLLHRHVRKSLLLSDTLEKLFWNGSLAGTHILKIVQEQRNCSDTKVTYQFSALESRVID